MQSPSRLYFQRNMQKRRGKNNANTLFDINKIPTDNHIRKVLDGVSVKETKVFFYYLHRLIIEKGIIEQYKHINNSLLVLLDGTYTLIF